MRPFGTSAHITQRANILLAKPNLVVQYHYLIALEDKYNGRESWATAHFRIGIIVCILNELQHKVGVPSIKF